MDDNERIELLKECIKDLLVAVREQHLLVGAIMRQLGRYEREEAEQEYALITTQIADSMTDIHYLLYQKKEALEIA